MPYLGDNHCYQLLFLGISDPGISDHEVFPKPSPFA